MVIWHPLWMPLRVFVCPPAALEAGQTFLDLPLAVALDAARPRALVSSSVPVPVPVPASTSFHLAR